jgi:hypothetical protein
LLILRLLASDDIFENHNCRSTTGAVGEVQGGEEGGIKRPQLSNPPRCVWLSRLRQMRHCQSRAERSTSLWLREEVQAVLRRGGGGLNSGTPF